MSRSAIEAAVDARGLVPVAIKTLLAQRQIAFDLYLWPSKNRPPRLYREKHVPLEPGDLERLLDESVATLYTPSSEAQCYCDHVRSHVLADETIPVHERYLRPQGRHAHGPYGVVGKRGCSRRVEGQRRLRAGTWSPWSANERIVFNDLLADNDARLRTFTHISNVCTCCMVLAEAYGIHDRGRLMEIAQGALLHDMGKCYVPNKLLNKARRLPRTSRS